MQSHLHRRDDGRERERDELRRYGLEHDPWSEHEHELELADRLAEQASLPPGDAAARALARHRLGRGPSPYEPSGPPIPPPSKLDPGQEVTYRGEDGAGPARDGTVCQLIDEDGAAVVAFHGGGETAVSLDALEPRTARSPPASGRPAIAARAGRGVAHRPDRGPTQPAHTRRAAPPPAPIPAAATGRLDTAN